MKNPLAALSAMIICGAWLGAIIPFSYFTFIALVLIFALSIKLMHFRFRSGAFLFLLTIVLMFAVGLFRAQYLRNYNLSCAAPFAHQQVKIYAEVLAVTAHDSVTVMEVYTYRLEHNDITYKIRTKMNLVIYDRGFETEIRDVIVAQGEIELYEPINFYGDFSSRSSNASKGVFAKVSSASSKIEVIGTNKRAIDLLTWGSSARRHIKATVDKYLTGDEGALMKGILIGDKQDFSAELSDAFRKSGMSHIVAVSGLHVGIFIIFISFGVWGFTQKCKLSSVFLLCAIFAYTVIVGYQPSILRAALMAAFGILMENLKLRRDSYTALMFTTAVLTVVNPYLVHNIGFQFSFLATLGIILLQGRIFKYAVANAGVAAFLFTAPLLAYSFNTITFASLFTNILVSPLVIISLFLGYIMCIIPILGIVLSPILFCINHVMILISKFFASIKFLIVSVASPSLGLLVCCFLALYVAYQFIIGNRKKSSTFFASMVLIALLLVNTFAAISQIKDVKISFVAQDSGDGVHIRTPNGHNLIIDAGNGADIYLYLQKRNVNKIDALILTNFKKEDTSGVDYLIANVPITLIYLPSGGNDKIKTLANEKGVELKYFIQGENISIDSVHFDVLMYNKYAKTANDSSAALKVSCYNTSTMLLGDFGYKVEQEMLDLHSKESVKSDIVRLSNHGAATSNSDTLIKATGARYAIANAGYNSSERLSNEVYKRLFAAKTITYKTYQSGTVSFIINKDGIKTIQRTRVPIEEDL